MTDPRPAQRYRFGIFEVDASTGELRRKGVRIKLNAQPFQLLAMLLERPGELLTREEISRELWPEGTFVDYEHGVSSAVNRIREAIGDTASNPRFVETLSRRGYRFVAPVERIGASKPPVLLSPEQLPSTDLGAIPGLNANLSEPLAMQASPVAERLTGAAKLTSRPSGGLLASPQDLPQVSYPVVQTLFLLLQLMYLAFYVGALANLPEIEDLLSVLPFPTQIFVAVIVTAAVLIPVRAFLLCAVLLHAPGIQTKFRTLWRFLLPLDVLWALSPFLLLHHINYGLALACTTLLVYSPFAQRSLMLMGAGAAGRDPRQAPAG